MDLLGGFVRPFLFGNTKNAGVKPAFFVYSLAFLILSQTLEKKNEATAPINMHAKYTASVSVGTLNEGSIISVVAITNPSTQWEATV